MSFDPNNVPLEYLLQPELLSERDIFSILEARCIRIDNMEHLNKQQLLELFYRVVTPKQQRTNNRRLSSGSQSQSQSASVPAHHDTLNKKLKKLVNQSASSDNGAHEICENNQPNGVVNNPCDKIPLKRNYNGQTNDDEPRAKKVRQKICWP